MCTVVPILRLLGLAVLAVGVAACLVGFVSPFWALYDPGLPRAPRPATGGDDDGSTTTPGVVEVVVVDKSVPGPTTPREPRRAAETEGLWARCDANNYTMCTWFWDNELQLEKSFPVWHLAAQALYLSGFTILVAAIVIACLHICCGCCKDSSSLPTILASLLLLAVVAILAALIVYGAFGHKQRGLTVDGNDPAAYTSGETAADTTAVPSTRPPEVVGDDVEQTPSARAQIFWAYYVAAAGAAASLMAAVIFFCDGRRSSSMTVESRGRGKDGYEVTSNMEM